MYPMRSVPLQQMHVGPIHPMAVHAPNVHPMAAPRPMQNPMGMADSHAFRMLLAQHLMNALQLKQPGHEGSRNPMNPSGVMP